MSLDEILQDRLSPDIYCLVHNKIVNLKKENQELKAKIKTYEDPEDLTLMFMYCDEKAKDKIKRLNKQLEELEEEIKKYQKDRDTNTKRYLEVKDYIKSRIKYCKEMTGFDCCIEELEEVLQRI